MHFQLIPTRGADPFINQAQVSFPPSSADCGGIPHVALGVNCGRSVSATLGYDTGDMGGGAGSPIYAVYLCPLALLEPKLDVQFLPGDEWLLALPDLMSWWIQKVLVS